ncbi:uncharacterized protein LOC131666802 isoform X2 [Phymastichus coffea]|uniref:uncharacterized protein LOC131666802 isoform X2 n=1 Tax=Phymastichus coffea TaxID=108790 RepID=UPI00273CB0BD|nr:uncharacterized protein LOC131666802 isoform X2 [Phymastichus coffea]
MVDCRFKLKLRKSPSSYSALHSKATIDSLDDDCLIHIFEFLSIADRVKIERVCKRWQTISMESWRQCRILSPDKVSWGLKKGNGNLVMDAKAIYNVLTRCGFYLKYLEFFGYLDELVTLGNKIGSMCPNLETIYLCGVSSLSIQNLSEYCTNIKELGLRDIFETFDNELSFLFEKNKNLTKMTFYSICGISNGKFFLNLPFESLKTLSIFNCDFSSFYVNQGIRKLKNLSELSFDYCENFDDDSMEAICNLTNLKEIHMGIFPGKIRSCKYMTRLNNLISIELSSSDLVNNELILALCKNCRLLSDVNISESRVTDEGVHCLTSLPYLQRLNINHLKIHDEAVHPMPNLKQFECFMCQELSDKCFSMLLDTSKNLELLNVGCCNVTNSTVKKAVDVTKLRMNNVILYMYIWGTKIKFDEITETSPLLRLLRLKRDIKAKNYL